MVYSRRKLEKIVNEQNQMGNICYFFTKCDKMDTNKDCINGKYKFCEEYYVKMEEYANDINK